jgi:cell division protein FtsN
VAPVAEAPGPAAPSAEEPVDLLTNAPAAEAAAVPAPADSGYLVQVSSQRSEEQARASFADMQRRFGSVLGSLTPNIQQADLGERGIYYRVRVGPWATRAEAVQVCETLRSAGGDCIVTQ